MDAVQPSASAGVRRRRWPWILAVVVGLVLVVWVGTPVLIVFGVATAADRGASCARCAALEWVDDMGSLWWDTDGEVRAGKDVAPARRSAVLGQRRAYIGQMRADIGLHPVVASTEFDPFRGSAPADTVNGNTATVVLEVAARWPNEAPGGLWFYSDTGAWRFDLRQDSTDWRIWTLTMPPWCGTYSRCGQPLPSLSVSTSPTPDDPLAPLRSMLPCGPKDPFRDWHSCSPIPAAS